MIKCCLRNILPKLKCLIILKRHHQVLPKTVTSSYAFPPKKTEQNKTNKKPTNNKSNNIPDFKTNLN